MVELVGYQSSGRKLARISGGVYEGFWLYQFNENFAVIIPEVTTPGIVPAPELILGFMGTARYPYGYPVDPD